MKKKLKLTQKRRTSGRIPFGFDSTGSHLIVNQNEAEIVREIFNDYCYEKLPIGKIVDNLNTKGIKNKSGNVWTRNSISQVLKRKEYKESIIDPEVFDETQKILDSKKNTPNIMYPLSSLLICGNCGNTMFCRKRKYKNTTYRHYVCKRKHFQGEDKCNQENIDAAEIEELVLSDLKAVLKQYRDKFEKLIITGIDQAEIERHIEEICRLDVNDLDETRAFFEFFIEKIVVDGDNIEIEYKFNK